MRTAPVTCDRSLPAARLTVLVVFFWILLNVLPTPVPPLVILCAAVPVNTTVEPAFVKEALLTQLPLRFIVLPVALSVPVEMVRSP